MSKYCHDATIHRCLIECEKCSAYYDDEQLENSVVTEKDCEDFIEEKIRADERKRFAFWLINRIHRNSLQRVLSETKNFDIMGIDNILSIYEKEQKGEN